MICRQVNNGPCKTYLLVSEKSQEVALVDPLLERLDEYLALLRKEGLRLAYVLDTHTHADHLSGCLALRDKAGAQFLMHESSRAFGVSRGMKNQETVSFGDVAIQFLHTPGHTNDSMTLIVSGHLLSGDFLFIGSQGAGRLDLPGSDPGTHFDSLKQLDALPDAVAVMPAHDYQGSEQSTMGAERKSNPVLTPRGRDAYIRWWSQRRLPPEDWMKEVVKANLAGPRDPRAVSIPKGVAACACAAGPAEPMAQDEISAEDLARLLKDKPKSLVLLDVRTVEEYTDELGHIEGTILIPVDELDQRTQEVPPGEIISICRSGKRAGRAAGILAKAGRDKIRVLTGGMLAWNERGLPVA